MTTTTTVQTKSKLIGNYILSAIDSEGYGKDLITDAEKLQFLVDTFNHEYSFTDNLKRYPNTQDRLKNWIMGLPSSFNIDFSYFDIIRVSTDLNLIPIDATQKQKDKIISNWFNLIAYKTIVLMRKNNISL